MYLKYASVLVTFSLVMGTAWLCVRGVEIEKYAAETAFLQGQITCVEELLDYEKASRKGRVEQAASIRPVIGVSLLKKKQKKALSETDYGILLKIVEAEAGTQDEEGRLLVANVVLNRVKSRQFPDTIREVVYQKDGGVAQFSPVGNGRIDTVSVSEETIAAVDRALAGEDISCGALYFAARGAADPENMHWFDENLTWLFAHDGHEFFR